MRMAMRGLQILYHCSRILCSRLAIIFWII